MKRTAMLLLAAAIAVVADAFNPHVTLSVAPRNIMVTESAEATICIYVPRQFPANPSITAGFIPQGTRLTMEREQVAADGANVWRYTVRVPVKGEAPGEMLLGPVKVAIPTRMDFFGFVARTAELQSGTARLMVEAPPEKDRPRSFCGAIAQEFGATASLDTNICTAGDPLLLTLEMSGATDAAMVHAPPMSAAFRNSPFKIDESSLKTETLAASKRFTWRVRAMKAGTVEFPPIEVSWFDAKSRTYRTTRTEPIPIQVKAGEQAALGSLDSVGGETDEFPMPDGLDLPFEAANFTLKHAISLAMRAEKESDFLAAAERYASFIESLEGPSAAGSDGKAFESVHWSNLGALYVMAGKPRKAIEAYERSEHVTGATAGTERGLRAAYARLKNDPRAELPLQRILFPFWFRFSFVGRMIFAVSCLFGFAVLFWIAMRAGRKLAALAAICGVAFSSQAQGWPFGGRSPFAGFFDDMQPMRIGRGADACPIRAKAWFGSTRTMVGEPVELVVTVDPGSVRIEPGSIRLEAGLPEPCETGNLRNDSPNVFKLRAVFLEPGTNDVGVAVRGVYSGTYCVTNGNMISSGRVVNQPFKIDLEPAHIAVSPLPSNGRPLDFCGAVGTRFEISQTLSKSAVRPGDLITAEYRLSFDGYCPSNAEVRVDNISREFKAYDVKEVSRSAKAVAWQQILVPRTTEATNTALVSFSFYNLRTKRYERTIANPQRLTFVSAEAATTENTRVMVNGPDQGAGTAEGGRAASLTLRFAPSAKSPVVVTLPPGTETRETGRREGWRRLESSRGAGWTL